LKNHLRSFADNNLMLKKLINLIFLIAPLFNTSIIFCQIVDSVSFRLFSRYSYYSYEKSAEMILHIPQTLVWYNLKVSLMIENDTVYSSSFMPGKKISRLPFDMGLSPGEYKAIAEISVPVRKVSYISSTELKVLPYKSNEVKADNLTGGLIVNKRQFVPFGFYCYSPVSPTLPEEEAIKGFNMISPYQKILPETLRERKAYMDRCARLGMKVHYNLLSVSGGGGVGSDIEGLTGEQKREMLINEIYTFMNHPALLAWYISDEPNGHNIEPEILETIYETVKAVDPWHPVSIVFMVPFLSAVRYSNALDIVMADPYPVPDASISQVGIAARQLRNEFNGKKPVWIVPQAFGGGELWSREPTVQEIRSMTYQAIINGARGIQYFVRQGLNIFPKSVATWNECGRMAMEIAEITPWLLSDEVTVPVRVSAGSIQVASALHDGQLLVMAVNRSNTPQQAEITIAGGYTGRARVLFENRTVFVNTGIISDPLPAYGSQVYLITLKRSQESVKPYPGNLVKDPGFEDISSPGIPASCYAWNGGDRGATYFLDSREHYEGKHSLRIVTPEQNKSIRLRFFPINIIKGRTYVISIYAMADPEQRPVLKINAVDSIELPPQYFEISLGETRKIRFIPENKWNQFVTSVTIPFNKELPSRMNVILSMPGSGVAWFDMLQVFEAVDLKRSVNPELRPPWEVLW